MTTSYRFVSAHYWRRVARLRRKWLERHNTGRAYRVIPAQQGPYRWWVVKLTDNHTPTR